MTGITRKLSGLVGFKDMERAGRLVTMLYFSINLLSFFCCELVLRVC